MAETEGVDISCVVIADGREVISLPCVNPHLAPTLDVVGFAGSQWLIRITDAMGTVVWTKIIVGRS